MHYMKTIQHLERIKKFMIQISKNWDLVPTFYYNQFTINSTSRTMIALSQDLDLTYPLPHHLRIQSPDGDISKIMIFQLKTVHMSYVPDSNLDWQDPEPLAVLYTSIHSGSGNGSGSGSGSGNNEEWRLTILIGEADPFEETEVNGYQTQNREWFPGSGPDPLDLGLGL